ncbi:MAG: hypothetical protein HY691_02110 [Chloroflexi bacterium]|nr:hypothetical protein [Chloroflexota bacterium]
MRYKRGIAIVATLALLSSALVLFSACTSGVSQSEFDEVRLQLATTEKQLADVQQRLSKEQVEKLINEAADKKLNTVDTKLALWGVQPGTAPRMIEIAHYFNNMWFAAEKGNWTFAEFEVYRTDETVKNIKLVRPKRATEMDKWMKEAVEPLRAAVKAKDLPRFVAAYDKAIEGCNACHKDSEGGDISLKGVKVTRPTTPIFSNLDYKGID